MILANGNCIWTILSNVNLDIPDYNVHMLSVRLDCSGKWFDLGRYFDSDYEDRTPNHFSDLIGLSLDAILPISYDLSPFAIGNKDSLLGEIPVKVKTQLPLSELMKFIVNKHKNALAK